MEYTGLVKIRVQCNTNTSRLVFHSAYHNITKVAIKTINVTDIEDILVSKSQKNLRSEMVEITLNQVLVTGYHYDIYIGFIGVLTDYYDNGIFVNNVATKRYINMIS